jgi:HAD superfamily hydrolase (TIGR01509 family)
MQNKLIIFDCDGVLVDSEPLSNAVIAEQICELGIEMTTEEAIYEFAGTSLAKVRRFLEDKGKVIPLSFEEEYRRRSYSLFRETLQPVPGIREAIDQLAYNKCVASNGPLEKIRLNLNLTRLVHHFDDRHLFSAYEIQRWKPDPSLYQHAAAEMGFAPEDCLVIEDSHHGVEAALAAGMRVFAYAGRMPKAKLERPGVSTFTDMRTLPELVDGLGW